MGANQLPQDSSSQFVPRYTVSMQNALLFVCYKIVTVSNVQSLETFSVFILWYWGSIIFCPENVVYLIRLLHIFKNTTDYVMEANDMSSD